MAFFNWITQVGFEIEGIVIIVLLLEAMFLRGGLTSGTGLKILFIVGAVGIQFLMPFLGHATITKVLRWLSFVFIAVFAVMAVLIVPHVHLSHLHQSASWAVWTTALVVIISVGGLGWSENGNDYSRYLARSTPKAKTFWAATLGPAIPSLLLELLGAAAFAISPKTTGVTGVPAAFAAWFFWPYMVLALPQLFAINTIDLYSSGVTLQAIGLAVRRWQAVIIDTVVVGIVTALVIFKGNFYTDLSWIPALYRGLAGAVVCHRDGRLSAATRTIRPALAHSRARRPILASRRSSLASCGCPTAWHGRRHDVDLR